MTSTIDFKSVYDKPEFSDRVVEYVMSVQEIDTEDKKGVGSTKASLQSGSSDCGKEGKKRKVVLGQTHVSSAILAMKSPFFHSLFGNGMSETSSKVVELLVADKEGRSK